MDESARMAYLDSRSYDRDEGYGMRPTDEQAAINDAAATGANITIEAGAGTGKTSTLLMLAERLGRKRGAYIAFGKDIAKEAERKFPRTVRCKTSHGFAFATVGKFYSDRLFKAKKPTAAQTAQLLGITEPLKVDDNLYTEVHLARMVMATIKRFCHSADDQITRWRVPYLPGVDKAAQRALADYLVPIAQRAWDTDYQNTRGLLRFNPDHYLKMWALTKPQLPVDYVLLDEAQDSNPAVAALVSNQAAQQILVGDRAQSIFGWRGAVDAMENFDGKRFYLSQSFRFGPKIAEEANKWLSLIEGTTLRLVGFDQIPSRLADLDAPDAVLCRTNSGAIGRAVAELDKGRRVALAGGGGEIAGFAKGAMRLLDGRPTDYSDLSTYTTWTEVQEAVQQGEADDIKVLVNLVDKYGAEGLLGIVDRLSDERYAEVVVSTAHKSKGREWARVQIASDFPAPKGKEGEDGEKQEPKVSREDAMLAYVAVTRAKEVLDREGLAWVDDFVAAASAPAPAAVPEPRTPDGPVIIEPRPDADKTAHPLSELLFGDGDDEGATLADLVGTAPAAPVAPLLELVDVIANRAGQPEATAARDEIARRIAAARTAGHTDALALLDAAC
ncbi:UvrD-helicase domain-containing protein [Micromonospora craterilacus]|uniref:UvrD-helicase domain-containing protein n=1 Tax=Micromonospora craterilacus TaxID=1655439 RepID=UPI0018F73211|nr:UvrD-helicase domain-containing protein [Micromonospora craterilacus]